MADKPVFPVAIITLGCKLNQLESEALAGAFKAGGFPLTVPEDLKQGPGILIINTCTVTSKADQKSRRFIRRALRENYELCVVVTGCYAELDSAEIAALEDGLSEPGTRRLFVVGGKEHRAGLSKSVLLDLPVYVRDEAAKGYDFSGVFLPRAIESWLQLPAAHKSPFRFKPETFNFHSRGYLKIQDGCNNACTYCRVRLARGPSVSLPHETMLAELRAYEAGGCAELMITGVNITQYQDSGFDLAVLLEYLLEGSSSIALRLASLEPEGITERLALVLAHPRIRPHFHLSAQSGSDTVLRIMGRRYNAHTLEEAAVLLRSVKDNPFLACDIIAGFPGETEDDFSQTLALCEKTGFAWIHAFPFSRRPGTAAFSFANSVGEWDIAQRVKVLTDMALRGRRRYAQTWLGRELSAVIEKGKPGSQYRAVSENYLKLLIDTRNGPPPGAVVRCVPVLLCEGAHDDLPDAVAVLVQ